MEKIFLLFVFIVFVNSSIIAQADIIVSGAGTASTNGTYVFTGTFAGHNVYAKGGITIEWHNSLNYWRLLEMMTVYYTCPDNCGVEPPNSGWLVSAGGSPIPTLSGGICGVLPVELISFSVEKRNERIELVWQTASEINNSGFEIQHSRDGSNWEQLDFVESTGNSTEQISYSYTHVYPVNGINYYRLKQIDFDGAFEYSKIISTEAGESANDMFFSPNPSNKGGQIILHISSKGFEAGELTIFDINGKAVLTQNIASQTPAVDISGLSEGIYYAAFASERKQMVEKFVIK